MHRHPAWSCVENDAALAAVVAEPVDGVVDEVHEDRVYRRRIGLENVPAEGISTDEFDLVIGKALLEQLEQKPLDLVTDDLHLRTVQAALHRREEREVAIEVIEARLELAVWRAQFG